MTTDSEFYIKRTEVRTFNVQAFCDCGGEFYFTGEAHSTWPPQYVHNCKICKRKWVSSERYPHIEYV